MTQWSERGGPVMTGTIEIGRYALRFVGADEHPRDVYFEEIACVTVERDDDAPALLIERAIGGEVRVSGDGLQEVADALSHLQVTSLAL